MEGYYYLHTNGDLIFKKFEPESDSPFVRKIWHFDTSKREDAWRIVLEALSYGANLSRVLELSKKWGLSVEDSLDFLASEKPSAERKNQVLLFMENVYGLNEDQYFDKIDQEAVRKEKRK